MAQMYDNADAEVNITEQGNLVISNTPTTFTNVGGETLVQKITVPTGKRWILKSINTTTNNFVGSHNLIAATIEVATKTISLVEGTSGNISLNYPQSLVLRPGDSVRFVIVTTAYTSGQKNLNLMYSETNI